MRWSWKLLAEVTHVTVNHVALTRVLCPRGGDGDSVPKKGQQIFVDNDTVHQNWFSHTTVSSFLTKLVLYLWRLPSLLIFLWVFESHYWTRKLREVMVLGAPGDGTHEWVYSIL